MTMFEFSQTDCYRQEGLLCLSTPFEAFSYEPAADQISITHGQVADTGRRSWKTLKGRAEAVWPPTLEAALVEALERYKPESVGIKSARGLARFPMRNRFISDYIYEVTGKRRTPKQVGSRLQQMRDTCKVQKLKKLLIHDLATDDRMISPDSDNSDSSGNASPSPSSSRSRTENRLDPFVVHVAISFLSDALSSSTIRLEKNTTASPQIIQPLAPCSDGYSPTSIIPFSPIVVQFPSPYPLALQTTFTTYTSMSSSALHTEHGVLDCIASPNQGAGWLYSTTIVPDYWKQLRSSTNISKYTIVQTLNPVSSCSKYSADGMVERQPISIIYTFRAPPARVSRHLVSEGVTEAAVHLTSAATNSTPVAQSHDFGVYYSSNDFKFLSTSIPSVVSVLDSSPFNLQPEADYSLSNEDIAMDYMNRIGYSSITQDQMATCVQVPESNERSRRPCILHHVSSNLELYHSRIPPPLNFTYI